MDMIEQKIEDLKKEIELLNQKRDKLIFDKVSQTYTNSYWKCKDDGYYFKITKVKEVFGSNNCFTYDGYFINICNFEISFREENDTEFGWDKSYSNYWTLSSKEEIEKILSNNFENIRSLI